MFHPLRQFPCARPQFYHTSEWLTNDERSQSMFFPPSLYPGLAVQSPDSTHPEQKLPRLGWGSLGSWWGHEQWQFSTSVHLRAWILLGHKFYWILGASSTQLSWSLLSRNRTSHVLWMIGQLFLFELWYSLRRCYESQADQCSTNNLTPYCYQFLPHSLWERLSLL